MREIALHWQILSALALAAGASSVNVMGDGAVAPMVACLEGETGFKA